jgi:heterodisulfide reductase subunit C
MSEDLWDWIQRRLGQPVRCGMCDAATPAEQTIEGVLPRRFVDFALPGKPLSIVVHEVVRLCPACSMFGTPQ